VGNLKMRCEKCGNVVRFDRDGKCLICGHTPPNKPRFELPRVDASKLADGVAEKEKVNIEKGKFVENIVEQATGEKYEGKLKICPHCGYRTWFYDRGKGKHVCFRSECPTNSVSKFLTDHLPGHPEGH